MTAVLETSYFAPLDGVPAWHSRILWDSIARDTGATVSASSTDSTEAYLEAPVSDQTWEWWRATSQPATWQVDAGQAVNVSGVGIAAHDIGTQGATVEAQYSSDGSTWTTVDSFSPSNDEPILFMFGGISAQYWRIRLSGGTNPPRIAVCYIGEILSLQRPIQWQGHSPSRYNARIKKQPNTSERGQRLGTTLIREGYQADYTVENLREEWVRDVLEPFILNSWKYGYFVAWRPVDFPEDVAFAWTDEPIVPSNSGSGTTPRDGATQSIGRRMSVQWSAKIHGGQASDIAPWGSV